MVPLLVHCSAGVGRTGTFVALDILLDALASKRPIDVFDVVAGMRKKRMLMVQTEVRMCVCVCVVLCVCMGVGVRG